MKCRLCGQPPTGTDDLCSDCSRALKRAREGGAALRLDVPAPARDRRAVDRITLGAPKLAPYSSQSPRRQFVTLALLGVVAAALIYVGARGLEDQRAREAAIAEAAVRAAATQKLRIEIEAEMVDPEVADVQTSVPAELPPPRPAQRTPSGTRTARPGNPAPGGAAAMASSNSNAAAGERSMAKGDPDAESSVRLARATVPQAAAVAEDGQSLSAALEKCSEERFLAGVICEQKARLRYCDGKWGQVPQCTAKPRAE